MSYSKIPARIIRLLFLLAPYSTQGRWNVKNIGGEEPFVVGIVKEIEIIHRLFLVVLFTVQPVQASSMNH